MKRLKTVIGLILVALACFFMPLNSLAHASNMDLSAEVPQTIDWVYVNRTSTSLSISSVGEATATAHLTGYPGTTTEVWIFMYLEKYSGGSWTTINSWYQSYYTYTGTLQQTANVSSGYWYRVKASYYAYSGDDYEHIVQYSSSVYR